MSLRCVLVYGDGRVETRDENLGVEHHVLEHESGRLVRERVFVSVGLARERMPTKPTDGSISDGGPISRVYVETPRPLVAARSGNASVGLEDRCR